MEILRIISMMMVVALHYMNKTIGGGLNTELPVNIISSHIIESVCITSVNIFVLISGYYMQSVKTTGLKKAIDLYLLMLFYHLPCFGVAVAVGVYQFSLRGLVYAIAPFLVSLRWFLETYIILLLIAPFLNTLLDHINQRQHQLLIIIQILIFSIWPSFLPSAPITDNGYGITNFITLYFISGYIRRYVVFKQSNKNRGISLAIFAVSCAVITISSFITYLKSRAWGYCYIFNIIASVSMLVLFLNLPKTNIKLVNTVATTTFGVYIMHTMLYFQPLIYKTLLQTDRYLNSPFQPLHCVISVILLFVACSVLDLLRQKLWKITVKVWLNNSKILRAEREWEAGFMLSSYEA